MTEQDATVVRADRLIAGSVYSSGSIVAVTGGVGSPALNLYGDAASASVDFNNAALSVAGDATGSAVAPAVGNSPTGYVLIQVGGVDKKLPYYDV